MTSQGWPPMQRDGKSAEFFAAAEREELVIKGCNNCAQSLPPESAVCSRCGRTALSWLPAAGTATLISWTVVHRAPNGAYIELVPYTVGIIELTEGPWLYGRIETDAPVAGMALKASFVHPEEGESYPLFVESDGQ